MVYVCPFKFPCSIIKVKDVHGNDKSFLKGYKEKKREVVRDKLYPPHCNRVTHVVSVGIKSIEQSIGTNT